MEVDREKLWEAVKPRMMRFKEEVSQPDFTYGVLTREELLTEMPQQIISRLIDKDEYRMQIDNLVKTLKLTVNDSLPLQVNPEHYKHFIKAKEDTNYQALRKEVLKRDDQTCQTCKFRSQFYMEVINPKGSYQSESLDGYKTYCPFCAQCFFVDAVGKHYGDGILVYIPELSQSTINSICHMIFFEMVNAMGISTVARRWHEHLRTRYFIVEEKIGEVSFTPHLALEFMTRAGLEQKYINRMLHDLRILPNRLRFSQQLITWHEEAFKRCFL